MDHPGYLRSLVRPLRLDEPAAGSLASRGLLGAIGIGVQGIQRFLITFLVAHVAGRDAVGVVATAVSTALLLSLLWPTTAGSTASKFVAMARGAGDTVLTRAVAAQLARRTVATTLLLAAAAVPLWMVLDGGSPADAACVAALVIGYCGYSFTRGLQFGVGQVPRATAWDILSAAGGLAGLVVVLLAGGRGPVLLLPLAAAYGLYTVAGWPHGARGRPAAALRRELDEFVALGVLGTVASTGLLQLSLLVARIVAGTAGAGQYAVALSLATPASLLAGSLSLVLFPSMAEAWGRGDIEGLRRQTDQATRALIVVMVSVFGALVLCSRLLVAVLYRAEYRPAADVLPVLLMAVLATTLAVATVNALTTRSRRGVVVASGAAVVGMLVGIVVWAVLAPHYGIMGVAIGYLCGTATIAAIPFGAVWRGEHHEWATLTGRLIAGLVLIVALVVVQRALATSLWTDPAFAAVFVLGWAVLMHRDIGMATGMLRARRRRATG